jgi:eukaryotic translation initiation factor 2C
MQGASGLRFRPRDSTAEISVADYFRRTRNRPLQYPHLPCIEVMGGALLPFEICVVPPGQIMRRQIPPELVKQVLDFATKRPPERLQSIRNGLEVGRSTVYAHYRSSSKSYQVLAYGQSEYVRQFGMNVTPQALNIDARVLPAPTLRYGVGSRQPTIVRHLARLLRSSLTTAQTPRDGAWNLIDKRFYRPVRIDQWAVVVYEHPNRFPRDNAQYLIQEWIKGCETVGITVNNKNPPIFNINAQLPVHAVSLDVVGIKEKCSWAIRNS